MVLKKIITMFKLLFYLSLVLKIVQSAEINSNDFVNCGGEYSGYNYRITSPNYPKNYPENVDCIYVLKGSHLANCNQIFHLQFLDFSLKPSENCRGDFLEIGDGSVFCGNVGGIRRYTGRDNALRIRFHSSKIDGIGRGFNISITTLPCPIANPQNTSFEQSSKESEDKNDENIIPEVEPITEVSEGSTQSLRVDYSNLYPIYRPQTKFTIEEGIESTGERLGIENVKNSTDDTKLFNRNPSEQLEVVTEKNPVRISAYFFAPPDTGISKKSTNSLSEQSPPLNYEFLPFRLSQKIERPIDSYGLPHIIPYSPIHEIKTGEVLENTGGIDCVGKNNINEGQLTSLGSNYLSSSPSFGLYPASTYGQPGPSFSYSPYTPFSPPTQYLPSGSRPNGFVPTLNPGNYFPTVTANSGQCCKSLYSSRRFLLASPGFPSLIYSGNPYQCFYTIAPYSPETCRLRLSLKFFNFGTDDQFCSNGYLEIDGRRYCGCKTGLNIVSNIPNLLSKTINIRYTGFPRTKLSGFLIEVSQESCAYNNYPYLSRSKKDVGNGTLDGIHEFKKNIPRIKRNAGYSYPKPDIPFDSVEENFGRTVGTGHLGFSSAAKCQAFSLIDWTLAAKETYLRNARCTPDGSGFIPSLPNNPGNGNIYPVYPGGGNVLPNYPGTGNIFPNYPGTGSVPPNFPPNNGYPGNISPGYPGSGQPGYSPPGNGIAPSPGSCETVGVTEGIISSPFYPNPYPNSSNKCWRFYRAPIVCRLELSFLDFDVEASPGCVKDYVTISNQNTRYCGRTLAGSKTLLGFPTSNFIDIRFLSDNFGTGKGFTIAFSQIPCQVEANR